jgi:indolepyruvate ferredoxin oxidoreductase
VLAATGPGHVARLDADQLAVQLVGDSLYTNPLMLGFAWQKGRIPLSHAALMRAIELNNVQVENNKLAFEWGRRAAHDLPAVLSLLRPAQVIEFAKKAAPLDELLARRAQFLTEYQNRSYAQRYTDFVNKVRSAEAPLHSERLSSAVARYLFKLMAYKDEYEVARLHSDPRFLAKVAAQFEGDYRFTYHLAPPLWSKKNAKGELQKRRYGAWVGTGFRLLARLKFLRGTPLDVFGRSEERRVERELIGQYMRCIEELVTDLRGANLALAVRIASLPEDIRGYGHVKERHLRDVRPRWDALMQEWRGTGQRQAA